VGRQAEEIVAGGGLLPDDVMLKVVTSKLDVIRNKVLPVSLPPRVG
jgi:adenylate kinase